MSRFVHIAVSYATVVGYFLAVTWGPAWHDHHQGCCDIPAVHEDRTTAAGSSHSPCCLHHHAPCGAASQTSDASEHSPCPAPCQDEDCIVCQMFAHPPLAAPTILLVDASGPVPAWVMQARPEGVFSLPAAYDSRGPPLV